MSSKHHNDKWAEIVAKAWTDEAFKKRLIANPKKVLEEHGINTHTHNVKVMESSNDMSYFILPKKPSGHLSEQQLRDIAAAGAMTKIC